jgi:hypothetical protein
MKRLLCIIFSLLFISACGGNGGGEESTQATFTVEVYDSDKACNGTTLFTDCHDSDNPRVIEVNMDGEIVWELRLKNAPVGQNPGWFYKAQRISS